METFTVKLERFGACGSGEKNSTTALNVSTKTSVKTTTTSTTKSTKSSINPPVLNRVDGLKRLVI